MIKIEINNQTKFRVPKIKIEQLLKCAQNQLKIKEKQLISLAFVGSAVIKKLNKVYRKKDRVTDVLSFEEKKEFPNDEKILGEIIICPAQAKKQAKGFGQSFKKEILKLVLHGYLHLLGYDHEKKKDAEEMEKLEGKLLNC